MAIVFGYTDLAAIKSRLGIGNTYTAATIAFVNGTSKITDSALGLEVFATGQRIQVSGSTSNDGFFTIATGGVAAEIVTGAAPADEAAGATVTITDVSDVVDDATLESVVTAISRAIDNATGRRFYRNAADETRYYTLGDGDGGTFFCPDDIGTITTLKTDSDGDRTYEDTWTATDYDLMPYNAALDGWPYLWIEVTPEGDYSFPAMAKGIEIDGKFGFSSTAPATITEACLLMAEKLFKRKDLIFGSAGSVDLGMITTQIVKLALADAEIQLLLAPYKRLV